MNLDSIAALYSMPLRDLAELFIRELDQFSIALFGATAAWLSQARTHKMRRWACVFGILAQPGFFWASWQSGQWGVFMLTTIYAGAWVRGLWVHWLSPHPEVIAQGLTISEQDVR